MHIAPFDNQNQPIVDAGDATVPLNYFNIVKLKKGEAFEYQVPGYETCIVPATGTVDVDVEGVAFAALGERGEDVWDGDPQGVYVPSGAKATMVCTSDDTEVFVAGAKYDKVLEPFDVRASTTSCNTAPTTPRPTARSSTSSARSRPTRSGGSW